MTARNEPPDRLDQLRVRHAELLRAVREAGFDEPPRLRDRNPFVNWLLNGERDVYERVRPRWLEYQRNSEKAARIKAEINSVVRQKVMDEPGYRALVAEADRERKAKRSCVQLIGAIRAAQEEITRVTENPRDEESRAAVRRDAEQVRRCLDAVRRGVDDLRTNLPAGRSFQPGELAGLKADFSRGDSPRKRSKKYAEVGALLGSLRRTVSSLLDEISARESGVKARQHQYMKDGLARYDR